MGFFDNLKRKKEAKQLGLEVSEFDGYLSARQLGLSLEEYKRFLRLFSGQYSLDQFRSYLNLEKKKLSGSQIERFLDHLSEEIPEDAYVDFLEAEKLGMTLKQYQVYLVAAAEKMSVREYMELQKALSMGISEKEYERYCREFRDSITLEEYQERLKAEILGLDSQQIQEYFSRYRNLYTFERYLDFAHARALGMTLDEYDSRLQINGQKEAVSSGAIAETISSRQPGPGEIPVSSLKKDVDSSAEIPASAAPEHDSAPQTHEIFREGSAEKADQHGSLYPQVDTHLEPDDQPGDEIVGGASPEEVHSVQPDLPLNGVLSASEIFEPIPNTASSEAPPAPEASPEEKTETEPEEIPNAQHQSDCRVQEAAKKDLESCEYSDEHCSLPASPALVCTAAYEGPATHVDTADLPLSNGNYLRLSIPHGYLYSTDPAKISENRVLTAIAEQQGNQLDQPYGATESMTVLAIQDYHCQKDRDGIVERLHFADSYWIKPYKAKDVSILWKLAEHSQNLCICRALLFTEQDAFAVQFFGQNSLCPNFQQKFKEVMQNVQIISRPEKQEPEVLKAVSEGNPLSEEALKQLPLITTLRSRYPNGSRCRTINELVCENPDLMGAFQIFLKSVETKYKKTAREFLIENGLLLEQKAENGRSSPISDFRKLKMRYAEFPFDGSVSDLRYENKDLNWEIIDLAYRASDYKSSFRQFLIDQKIIYSDDRTAEEKLNDLMTVLWKRYPAGFSNISTIRELQQKNRDLDLSQMATLIREVHHVTPAYQYLFNIGFFKKD